MIIYTIIISATIGLALGILISTLRSYFKEKEVKQAKESAKEILERTKNEAEKRSKEIILKAKEEGHQIILDVEKEVQERRKELKELEKKTLHKEEVLEKREQDVVNKEKNLNEREKELEEKKQKLEEILIEQNKALEQISGLSVEDAKKFLLKNIENEVRTDAAKIIKEIEAEAKKEGIKKAREIISLAMQRCAMDQVVESTVSVVPLPNDEMKGRLIGREGRNIRCFESLTGINLIVDDTPEAVVISGFDPIRREIARLALEKMILDGRIQPARIEEIVEKSKKEIEEKIRIEGENTLIEMGIGVLHPELTKLVGRLHFRTSYGQNALQHSKEVCALAQSIAAELDVDVNLSKRAGLLHDIGKAVDFEVEGPHAAIGVDLARRYKESKGVVHAIACHHGEEEPQTIEAIVIQVADAISASRPGARRDTLESYVKRLEKLEKLAQSFNGIEKAYAIQAGREIRIMVKPDEIDDAMAVNLSREIAKKVEEELQYPGQIKVTVVRETRAVEYAK